MIPGMQASDPFPPVEPVSVIIPTRDRPDDLARCLESLASQLDHGSEVIVVAGSEPCCPRELVARFSAVFTFSLRRCPDAKLARARNIGLDAAAHPIVLFIDDDAIARPGWVEAYRSTLRDHAEACVASGLVVDARPPSPEPEFAYGLIHPSGRQIAVRASEDEPHPPGFVPSVKGCSFALHRERAPGGVRFDEFFRFAFDETDLLMTLREAGGVCVFVPGAVVDHLHTPGLYRTGSPMQRDWRTDFASHTMFMRKHTRGIGRLHGWGVVIARLLKHALRAARACALRDCGFQTAWRAVSGATRGVIAAAMSRGTG